MKFRPCIDIHNGKVKQIVGGSLRDQGNLAKENYTSEDGARYFAKMYRRDGLKGGHIILLNPQTSDYYEATRQQALEALRVYPRGMQIGGGICAENAKEYIEAGASHVIVTSYVFRQGQICMENLTKLVEAVGREHIVLDLSCRKKADGAYYVVTDRWQTFTDVKVETSFLNELSAYCDEFLVHGVDVEGKAAGIEIELVRILASCKKRPITYAGGIGSIEDLEMLRKESGGGVDFTIGSALDLFGGTIPYEQVKEYHF